MISFPCWAKWVLSGLGGTVAVVVFIVVVCALAAKGLPIVADAWSRLGTPRVPGRVSRVLVLVIASLFVGVVVVGSVAAIAMTTMEQVFGCDACLPESTQKNCTTTQLDRDRFLYESLALAHGWPTSCEEQDREGHK